MLQIGKHPAAGASRRPHPTALGQTGYGPPLWAHNVRPTASLHHPKNLQNHSLYTYALGESRAKEQGCTCVLTFVILHTDPSPRKINGNHFPPGHRPGGKHLSGTQMAMRSFSFAAQASSTFLMYLSSRSWRSFSAFFWSSSVISEFFFSFLI